MLAFYWMILTAIGVGWSAFFFGQIGVMVAISVAVAVAVPLAHYDLTH